MTDLNELDRLLASQPLAEPTLAGPVTERKHTHRFERTVYMRGEQPEQVYECRCGRIRDEAHAKRGKNSRSYGNRAELKVARVYGGTKIGQAGGPVDVRGKDFATQVKTHRRSPPGEWTKAFAAMAQDARCPRMLLRFVMGSGVAPLDYFVFQAKDFLNWFGRDE